MGLSKVLVGVTGAVIAISGVTAVALRGGGDDAPSERPAVSVNSNADKAVSSPAASGPDSTGSAASSAATSPSSVPPVAASPAVPVPTPGGTSAAAPTPSAQEVVESVTQLMNQLKQSASNNGVPQSISKEEVDKSIADMLAKLGVNK